MPAAAPIRHRDAMTNTLSTTTDTTGTTTTGTTTTGTTTTRSVDPKVAAVQRLYAGVGTNDLGAILAELDPDVDWAAEAASGSVPWYGVFHGTDEVPGFFAALGESVDIEEFTPLAFAVADDDVIVPVHWAYTVRATGKRAEMTMQHWWHFAGGKVVRFRGAEDTEQSAAAFSA